ncbi:3D (Asp-Asp-Asp) domain-containing protein [Planomicrobium soli]|uniref:3D (Asp-Asp-Asp) domain-containing protein n=1 Tax=Planomicrobium soli TaxID=1176648 RepID=A0A2P8GKE0_9BACL|nr:3D domain-containing protein [Planomicrobium soli]PSL34415.1 3D (Asp-Asp-Asp) domain-containing protein [Planomicrobium soli]
MKKLLVVLSFALILFLGTSIESSAAASTYTVKSGDTLYKISKAKKVSVSNIKSWNGLKSDKIKPNQKLKLKKPASKAKAKSKSKTPSRSSAGSVVKEFTVSSTAYTASCKGCSGITRTGINLKKNPGLKVIAVDPKVIKLGTKVHVEGYGYAVAGDTGGAIKGKKIDVFIPTQNGALKWGRKNVKIKILE